jgi:WD40 repeat protein
VQSWQAHREPVRSLAFTPDGRLLASVSDCSLRVRHLTNNKDILRVEESHWQSSITLSPKGRLIAWTGPNLRIREVDRVEPIAAPDGYVHQGCFSPDGKFFVSASTNETLRRWETTQWDEIKSGWGRRREVHGTSLWPTGCIAYHPGGQFVAAGFEDQLRGNRGDSVIELIDPDSRAVLATLRWPKYMRHPTRLAFSPDGTLLAILRVWDVGTQDEIGVLEPGRKYFNDVAFTPDGRRLVTVSNDAVVRLWNVGSWSEAGAFEWQIGKLGAVAVASDGLRMAAGGGTGQIVVWDVDE